MTSPNSFIYSKISCHFFFREREKTHSPIKRAIDNPMADQREYLPPTHCLIQINHSINPYHYEYFYVLIDFSLTVKAATLIFILGVVRLFHLLNKGNQVLFIIW